MSLPPNSRFSRYVVSGQLGVGSTGEVYRCHDPVAGREVALKILFPEDGVQDERTVAQFREEALIMRSLVHSSIPEFYDSGIENGVHYIVSEFLDGERLAGPIKPPELILIADQIAAGIIAMYHAGIVHRDLKPGNLIMVPDGHVKIIDFGTARRLTPEMAAEPDELASWQRLVRSEQLSFGMLLYELATGKGPFKDRGTAPALSKLLGEQLLPLPSESQFSLLEAVKLCAAEDGKHAELLLTAMSLALCLAGASSPDLET
jgi:serine/threonine-protein kinase